MRRLGDVLMSLAADRGPGVIYAQVPWTPVSAAVIADPSSVIGAPGGMAALIEADLAREYLRAWSRWQVDGPNQTALTQALLALVARRPFGGRLGLTVATHEVRTQSGRCFLDPSEDVMYLLFLDMEGGVERSILIRRLDAQNGAVSVHCLRDDDGCYVLLEEAGDTRSPTGVVQPSMPWAHKAVCEWIFLGRDVTGPVRRGLAAG